MFQLINFFVDLVLFRRKPQDIPASMPLMLFVLLASFLISLVHGQQIYDSLINSFYAAFTDIVFMMFVLSMALYVTHRSQRWIQTITALAGGSAVITAIAIPIQLLMGDNNVESTSTQIGAILYLIVIVWNLMFVGYIAKHVFDVSLFIGSLIAFSYLVFSGIIIGTVLPSVN